MSLVEKRTGPAIDNLSAINLISEGLTESGLAPLRKKDLRILCAIQCVSVHRLNRVEKSWGEMVRDLVSNNVSTRIKARKMRRSLAVEAFLNRVDPLSLYDLRRMSHKELVNVMLGMGLSVSAKSGLRKAQMIERILVLVDASRFVLVQ